MAAIVPAYNEEETLADVLSVLRSSELVDEIIVVSDGSDDRTAQVAHALGVRAIELKHNQGKGVALAVGVIHTRAPVLVFVDGDILNLSDYLLRQLIEPVTRGRCEMNIGIRSRGWLIDEIHRRIGPLLSGIRCLRREIFEAVPEDFLEGFRIEAALNWTCGYLGRRRGTTVFYQLKHRVKEKKDRPCGRARDLGAECSSPSSRPTSSSIGAPPPSTARPVRTGLAPPSNTPNSEPAPC